MIEDAELLVRLRQLRKGLSLGTAERDALQRLAHMANWDPGAITNQHAELTTAARSQSSLGVRRPKASALIIAVILLALTANIGAAYYSPLYAAALAATPVVGTISRPLLTATGLSGANVIAFDETSDSAGHRLHLVAGYADQLRTLIFVEIDGRSSHLGMHGVELTDQFGHSYGAKFNAAQTALMFEPLTGLAASQGGRLSLHIDGIDVPSTTGGPRSAFVTGRWTLHPTLFARQAHVLALPKPGSIDGTVYTFTAVRSSFVLDVNWTITGWFIEHRSPTIPPANTSEGEQYRHLFERYLGVNLYDSNGKLVTLADSTATFPRGRPALGSFSAILNGPGTYKLRFGDASNGFERPIEVPPVQ